MSRAVQEHRRRLTERGHKRVEVSVLASDADLLRHVAKALSTDDDDAQRLRMAIQGAVPTGTPVKFKDWLASLPD